MQTPNDNILQIPFNNSNVFPPFYVINCTQSTRTHPSIALFYEENAK